MRLTTLVVALCTFSSVAALHAFTGCHSAVEPRTELAVVRTESSALASPTHAASAPGPTTASSAAAHGADTTLIAPPPPLFPEDFPKPSAALSISHNPVQKAEEADPLEFTVSDSLDHAWATWVQNAQALGCTVNHVERVLPRASATFRCGAMRAALVSLASEGEGGPLKGTFAFARGAAETALKGACIPIPRPSWVVEKRVAGIDWQGHSFAYESTSRVTTTFPIDVDGDGMWDAFVPSKPRTGEGSPCTDELAHDVYLVRGSCAIHVGRIGPGTLKPLPADPGQMHAFSTQFTEPVAYVPTPGKRAVLEPFGYEKVTTTQTNFRFDTQRFVVAEQHVSEPFLAGSEHGGETSCSVR